MLETVQNFISSIKKAVENDEFIKLTLGKASNKNQVLRNIYIRIIKIKNKNVFSFTFREKTNDSVKNFSFEDALINIEKYLGNEFLSGHLFTSKNDLELIFNKKRKASIRKSKPTFKDLPNTDHNKKKKRILKTENNIYLQQLGITNKQWKIIPDKYDKFRQINKYIEVFENLIKQIELPKEIKITDMGSGKGYLAFALYDFLKNILKVNVGITGVERRKELVDKCNKIAEECSFSKLGFKEGNIKDFKNEKIDILIALHACDTATDEALYKGIRSGALIIVVAPCCHKQIRKEIRQNSSDDPIIKYGILLERQAEMITDTIRALILEAYGYKTNVFEFISTDHTPKNIMITASKTDKKINKQEIFEKIKILKSKYGIKYHELEKYLDIEY